MKAISRFDRSDLLKIAGVGRFFTNPFVIWQAWLRMFRCASLCRAALSLGEEAD
jgi:hypothetical protein